MTTQIRIPTGSYALPDPNSSCRDIVNCFSELAPQNTPQDSKQQPPAVVLRRAPGIRPFADDGTTNPCRGMWSMSSVLYTVIGPTLYSVSVDGSLTKCGDGIAGSGFVRMSDNTACLVILIPGTSTAYTYDLQSLTLKPLVDETFTFHGAIDLGFMDSYIIFLSANGRVFYNCDSQTVSGQGHITFTGTGTEFPREFGTDPFVGMFIDHREAGMLGERTSEFYVDAGNSVNSPFSSAPDNYMDMGCAAGYSVVKQDQSVFWIANDRTMRRRDGQTPIRVSNHGIESLLEQADLTGAYGFSYAIGGHLMVVMTMPRAKLTVVYDCTTTELHRMESFGMNYWRPLCAYYAYGHQLVGDSQSGKIGILDTSIFDEWGAPITATWTHQAIYDDDNRIQHRRLELFMGSGRATQTGQGSNPQLTLKVSDDGGVTFRTREMRSVGRVGQYANREIWWSLGQARTRVYQFQISDPVPTWTTDLIATLEGGKY